MIRLFKENSMKGFPSSSLELLKDSLLGVFYLYLDKSFHSTVESEIDL